MIVKICGITSLDQALAITDLGADMLGFNFYSRSPRYIPRPEVARISQALEKRYPSLVKVGVFVNEDPHNIVRALEECNLDLAQLSGDEPPEAVRILGDRAYKAFRLKSQDDLDRAHLEAAHRQNPPALLVDAYQAGQFGGTGQVSNWELAQPLAQRYPLLLAGGLTVENLYPALDFVQPWGVDVASGVESSPGEKDLDLVKKFIRIVRLYEREKIYDKNPT